jgi:hypothetical protein
MNRPYPRILVVSTFVTPKTKKMGLWLIDLAW